MNDISFIILKLVVSAAAALITIYVVPYLWDLRTNERYSLVVDMVETAVSAAEQTIKASGTLKKNEVTSFMTKWLNDQNIRMTQEQLDQLIEAAVWQIKHNKEG